MMDATRWILAETWLSLGLRIKWGSQYGHYDNVEWQGDDRNYIYDGHGVWLVRPPDRYRHQLPYANSEPPTLSADDMLHELAHWIAATEEQKDLRNFGMDEGGPEADEMEIRAMIVQRGIEATIRASSRIAQLAMGGQA